MLVPQRADGRNCDRACEVVARDVLREGRRVQARVLDDAVDALHQRREVLARRHLPRRV